MIFNLMIRSDDLHRYYQTSFGSEVCQSMTTSAPVTLFSQMKLIPMRHFILHRSGDINKAVMLERNIGEYSW